MTEPYFVAMQGHLFRIDPDMMEGVRNYIEHGIPPGGFLQAVICNDLYLAAGKADHRNIGNLPAYVEYFYNHAPMDCWGNKKKMDAWIERKGQERETKREQPEEDSTDE